jgi:regulator of cell morphogenesis and NO signaling
MKIENNMTLAEIVKTNYRTAGLLESYNLDYCCRGKRTLEEACAEAGVNIDDISVKLSKTENEEQKESNYDNWELDFLIDYIINVHHSYIKKYMPAISTHSEKVKNAHNQNHSEVIEIGELFNDVKNELEAHMMKEERMLFPYIKYLVQVKKGMEEYQSAPFGSVKNPINMMEAEHVNAGNAFYRIRELSNNYTPPADACTTFTTWYSELKGFEDDLHKHIHLENNFLHPKAIEMEKGIINKEITV